APGRIASAGAGSSAFPTQTPHPIRQRDTDDCSGLVAPSPSVHPEVNASQIHYSPFTEIIPLLYRGERIVPFRRSPALPVPGHLPTSGSGWAAARCSSVDDTRNPLSLHQ